MFAKSGSIIPMKIHNNELSLLRTINLPISLEIYLDKNNYAIGYLYIDDGETFEYKSDHKRKLIKFEYKDGLLK